MTQRFGYGLVNSTWPRYDPEYGGGGGGWGRDDYDPSGGGWGRPVIEPLVPGVLEISPPATPLVATVLPSGQVVVTHADPETGAPVYNATPGATATAAATVADGLTSFLEGETFGISNKLLLIGVAALLLLKK